MVTKSPYPGRNMKMQKSLHDYLPCHCPHGGGGKSGSKQGDSKNPGSGGTQQRFQGPVRFLDGADFSQSGVEKCRGRHDQHGHINESCQTHGDENVDQLIAKEFALLFRIACDDPVLCQRGVQIDHMGHDGCAENPCCKQDTFCTGKLRHDRHGKKRSASEAYREMFRSDSLKPQRQPAM